MLSQEHNIAALEPFLDERGTYTQPRSLEDKKGLSYYLPVTQCFGNSSNVDFTREDLVLFYQLVNATSVMFDEKIDNHTNILAQLHYTVFNKTVEDPTSDPDWEMLGFQNPRPGSDFRGGGLLSLQSLVYVCNKEHELVKEIINFTQIHSNYLFACVVIGSVYFLKNLLHFGVYKDYTKRIDHQRTGSRRALKYFLNLDYDKSLESRIYVFNEIVRAYNVKLFSFWKASCLLDRNIKIVDFQQAENEVKRIFVDLFEHMAVRADLSEKNNLKEFLDEFLNTPIDIVIKPTM